MPGDPEPGEATRRSGGFGFSIRSPRDFWGGLVLIAVAIFAIWAARDLPGQRGFAFGPGTAPRLFAGLLAILGAAVAVVGLVSEGPAIERYRPRGPVLVIIAILLFAALIRPFGLVVASYITFMIAILGSEEMRWVESLIGAAVMTFLCVMLFVYLLALPFQLWPQSNSFGLLWDQTADIVRGTVQTFQSAPPRP